MKDADIIFFSYKWLRELGQKLENFEVREIKGRIFVYSKKPVEKFCNIPGKYWTLAEYNKNTGEVSSLVFSVEINNMQDIEIFFNSL